MELIKRQGLIVWLYTLKHSNVLKRYGFVHYISQRLKYAVMYVDQDQTDKTIKQLEQLHFVRNVELSYQDDIDMTFADVFDQEDQDDSNHENGEFFLQIAEQIRENQAQD
ncbi:YlbG family protein [Ignavigranum ruoffiae]|uniref:UPF0298 protein SAMN04488558_1025 n=1 Tax=Ignavigranum ruoffiae TaxID=89093 RepID=A0A1H9AMP8_9LACT|nr:YlbG family protein [Ignavigranum ruoffiae]UPQ85748.1 YlbG family protein [Ignavigranum ruoffiae]SEP77198.1 Uncharacterized protein YlbG, UPF0298 family [Ignavigranum ruoffiae]